MAEPSPKILTNEDKATPPQLLSHGIVTLPHLM